MAQDAAETAPRTETDLEDPAEWADHMDTEWEIDDPEDMSQSQRIQEILTRRRQVIDARNQAKARAHLGDIKESEARDFYRSNVESLIIDVWATLTSISDEEQSRGRHYLENRTIAMFEVHPPEEILPDDPEDQERHGHTRRMGPNQAVPSPKTVNVTGLRWFLETDDAFTVTWDYRQWAPPKERTAEKEVMITFPLIDKALLAVTEWLAEAGIDADLSQGEEEAWVV